MTSDFIIAYPALTLLAVAIFSGLLAFIVTYMRFNRRIGQQETSLSLTQSELAAAIAEQRALETRYQEKVQTLHEAEIAASRLQAQVQAQQEKYQDCTGQLQRAEAQYQEARQVLESLTSEKHQIDTVRQTTQTELQENLKYQQTLQTRLDELADQLREARAQLDQQKLENATLDKRARAVEVKAEETELKYQDVRTQYTGVQEKLDGLQERFNTVLSEYTELKTSLDERDKSHQQQLLQHAENKKSLAQEFENLANKIFEEKGKTFTDTSKASLDGLLKPFREQIDGFQKRINHIHDASLKGNTELNAEIKKVLEIGLKMSDEASNLTSALKGDSQQRGAWGEAQLKRTLEMSGLIEDAHYETQSAFKDLDGKQKQTDYLIKLPDNKHIIIDSKVSLVAYDKAVSADSPEAQSLAMSEHVKAVKRHIDDLASKDYTNLIGMRSPSFVLMFMPIEPAYIDALKSNKDLFSYGYEKSIVLVSHTTLIPILRTVANLWMMERSNAEAREISEKAGEIYNQVCVVAERLQKLGGTLNTVSNHYNNTVKALVGQQGLHGKVERFSQLSSKVSKAMPALEATHLDFETERLSLAAEPIAELVPDDEVDAGSTHPAIENQVTPVAGLTEPD
ncbi:DNA recombination protein [Oleiphilus messinensis]|uniref:DNA recombination protein n=1 Tax=Oleiphilus messinensis TaxID=141451 RepID=A0A1Y0I2E9_9GAMM|nr:DNA recombination protein RmuC [Oleiphilus messinensis]ARU54389.1 DNA recombination protein [Oleiphilus messinensis]